MLPIMMLTAMMLPRMMLIMVMKLIIIALKIMMRLVGKRQPGIFSKVQRNPPAVRINVSLCKMRFAPLRQLIRCFNA